ncbi:MAG: PAS domain-containing protein [Henriciella sp.]|nr:PAS domain-containing protein [Henriciella sp.]
MMYESNSFSGLTKAQTAIISYWRSKRFGSQLPNRESIDPGVLRSHLAAISIVEIEPAGDVRFRLAGSEVRAVFGQEMRGRRLQEFTGPVADMWSLGLTAVLDKRAPVGGIITRANDRHAWLRLPLEPGNGKRLVLCHDMLLCKLPEDRDGCCQSGSLSNKSRALAA